MNIGYRPKKIEFKSLTTAILMTLLISGTIITVASSYLTGSAYGQLPPQTSPPPESLCSGTGSGNRVITGTPDPDTLIGTAINNLINGLGGDDRINGCAGNDTINGNTDDDGMAGGPGNDALNGNEGDDVMQGDSGNDLLSGGPGINVLTGGPGRDSFVCSPDGETTITDFVPGTDTMSGPCILSQPPTETATLIVRKIVQCLPEQLCPNLPDPDSGFLVFFASDTGGFGVQASEEGTPFRLLPGSYDASSEQIPPVPDGLLFVTLEGDDGCFSFRSGGPIQAGQERTCTITNTYRPE
jgi:hypothetical protein